jgi:hypothetical protein
MFLTWNPANRQSAIGNDQAQPHMQIEIRCAKK